MSLVNNFLPYEENLRKCINPKCKHGVAKVTFCPDCVNKLDIFKRIKIFMNLEMHKKRIIY